MNERVHKAPKLDDSLSIELPKIRQFSQNNNGLVLMPSGKEQVKEFDKPRRAIGFGREGEMISESNANKLLRELGYRRAIGYGREGERIKNEPIKAKHAVGFGRENEPPVEAAKPKHAVGFGREGEPPVEHKKAKHPIGFGRENEEPIKTPNTEGKKIGFDISKLKGNSR